MANDDGVDKMTAEIGRSKEAMLIWFIKTQDKMMDKFNEERTKWQEVLNVFLKEIKSSLDYNRQEHKEILESLKKMNGKH